MSNEREYNNWIFEQLEPELIFGPAGTKYKRDHPYTTVLKHKAMIAHIGEIEWERKSKDEQDKLWQIWDSTHTK